MFHVKQMEELKQMKLTMYNIGELMEKLPMNLSLTGADGTTRYTDRVVRDTFKQYSAWFCIGDFISLYSSFVAAYWLNYDKAFQALLYEYNPIQNYSMTETGVDVDNDGTTTQTRQNLPGSSTEQTRSVLGVTTQKNFSTTYDNPTPRLETYSETSQGDYAGSSPLTETVTTESKESVQFSEVHNPTVIERDGKTISGDKIKTHDFKRSGNIGVTTSQQMIESEITLRKHKILADFIGDFILKYCTYSYDFIDIERGEINVD